MASDINSVNISGNLTNDPELRTTQSGMPVLSFGLASNDRVKNNRTGEWEEKPNFIDCTMFGSRAEGISQYLSKGTKVFISGSLRYSSWERDGQKRTKIELIINDVVFINNNQGNRSNAPQNQYQQPQQYGGQPPYQQQAMFQGQPQYQQPAPQRQYQQSPYAAPTTPVVDTTSSVYDEDIPF